MKADYDSKGARSRSICSILSVGSTTAMTGSMIGS
jgi:hypothetical protein